MKPKLLIDVDGVLNPYAAKPTRRPEGYVTYRYLNGAWSGNRGDMRVWLNPAHGSMLMALDGLVEMWWCTSWMEMANTLIAPAVGLPKLPVVQFAPKQERREWTTVDLDTLFPGEAFAWLDDDFTASDLGWASRRRAEGIPTLLIPINPRIGLTQEVVNWVAEWALR